MHKPVGSPLNYTGGKLRLLPQIAPLLPADTDTLHDVFCGGGNVLANVPARAFTARDIQPDVMRTIRWMAGTGGADVLMACDRIIRNYGLSRSHLHGYAHYGCGSGQGLSGFNRDAYLRLRARYPAIRNRDEDRAAAHFLVMVIYAFNNQIRFGREGFNMPPGKRDMNASMRSKITSFCDRLAERRPVLVTGCYSTLNPGTLGRKDLVYADPPYLLGRACYNEGGQWTEADETRLLGWLDEVDRIGARFALSNVLIHKGEENTILRDWCRSRGWRVKRLTACYGNSSYRAKHRSGGTQEVLIMNYWP